MLVVCILTSPTGSSKYGTTRRNTQRYYTSKHLMRYIYSGATKTIQYVFISVGLAATVIRLAMMSYVLLRKFLLWRSGAKDQGLYPIFFSYFYPGKWSSGCRWVQENFTIENFSLTCRSIALFIWREREKKKEVVTTTKIFMRKALILLFLSFIILRIWR